MKIKYGTKQCPLPTICCVDLGPNEIYTWSLAMHFTVLLIFDCLLTILVNLKKYNKVVNTWYSYDFNVHLNGDLGYKNPDCAFNYYINQYLIILHTTIWLLLLKKIIFYCFKFKLTSKFYYHKCTIRKFDPN